MKPAKLGWTVLCFFLSGAGLLAFDAPPPRRIDLSGTWNADLTKSSFVAGAPRPKKWFIVIQQDERQLIRTETFVGQDGKSSGMEMTFTLDGKENRNQMDGAELVTTCRWEGSSLLIEGTFEGGIWTEKLALSPDGKSLHATSSIMFPGGQTNDTDITYVRAK